MKSDPIMIIARILAMIGLFLWGFYMGGNIAYDDCEAYVQETLFDEQVAGFYLDDEVSSKINYTDSEDGHEGVKDPVWKTKDKVPYLPRYS